MKNFFFFIAKIALIAAVIIISFILIADSYIHLNQSGYYQSTYSVTLNNLSEYSGGHITDILVPVPQLNEEYVFSDTELQGKPSGSWKSVPVVYKGEKMLAFQSAGENLTDISSTFVTDHRPIGSSRWNSNNLVLLPRISQSDRIATGENIRNESRSHTTTTLVYIPSDLTAHNQNPSPITVQIEYIVLGDRAGSEYIDDYRLQGSAIIPGKYHGEIPVDLVPYYRKSIPAGGDISWVPL